MSCWFRLCSGFDRGFIQFPELALNLGFLTHSHKPKRRVPPLTPELSRWNKYFQGQQCAKDVLNRFNLNLTDSQKKKLIWYHVEYMHKLEDIQKDLTYKNIILRICYVYIKCRKNFNMLWSCAFTYAFKAGLPSCLFIFEIRH